MVKPRVIETVNGIQGEFNVDLYDKMMRRMRDKGWIETNLVLKSGISSGLALEVGPGPGYLGLEWLKGTKGTFLKGLEISSDMIRIAERNAKEYNLQDRVEYVNGDAQEMPFPDNHFDAVFTNGSLHEWSEPKRIFNEVYRVLKPEGRYLISDLRRDMSPIVKLFMKLATKPKEIRPGIVTSINASYIVGEIRSILKESNLTNFQIKRVIMGLVIIGEKD